VNELPNGWIKAKLKDVSIKCDQNKPDDDDELIYVDIGSINRKLKKIETPQYLLGIDAPSRARKRINTNDVLVSLTRPNLNAVAHVTKDYDKQYASTGFEVIKPVGVDSRYLFALVRTQEFISSISGVVKGALYPAAKSSDVQNYEFSLAPLEEQKRIADKLDSLLVKVDAAQVHLDKIPTVLKRFRESVLINATSGMLTEEWRGSDEYKETNILHYRIPKNWEFLSIEDIGLVKGGKRLPKGEELTDRNTGLPYIRAGQLKNGTVVQGDNARNRQLFLEAHVQEQIKRYTVLENDVYITIVGASIGDAGVIPANLQGANLTENAAKITEFVKPVNSSFLAYWLRSERLQALIKLEIKSGAQGKLALKRIKQLAVPLPPFDEQNEIVRRVGELFSYADTVEKQYNNAKARIDRLTHSILAKAFRGELVHQNEAEEPAEKLLSQILIEKEKKSTIKANTIKKKANVNNTVNEESVKIWIKNLKVHTFSSEDLNDSFGSDYEQLKEILFSLLKENKPMISKVFDAIKKDFVFKKV